MKEVKVSLQIHICFISSSLSSIQIEFRFLVWPSVRPGRHRMVRSQRKGTELHDAPDTKNGWLCGLHNAWSSGWEIVRYNLHTSKGKILVRWWKLDPVTQFLGAGSIPGKALAKTFFCFRKVRQR